MRAIKSTLTIGERDLPTLRQGEALIKVKCFGVTQEDAQLYFSGTPALKLGVEFSGDVLKVFPLSLNTSNIKVGQRVMGFTIQGGSMAEFVTCPLKMLMDVPIGMPYNIAATIPDMWIGALRLLRDDGEFEKRNRVAIYGALSSRGQAAVQLAQLMGCRRVHCIVTSQSAANTVTRRLKFHTALSDEVIVHQESNKTLSQIAAYDPRGLEVVLDLRKEPEIYPNVMRPNGRLVITSKPLIGNFNWDLVVLKGIKIHGTCLRSKDPRLLEKHCDYITEHIVPKIKNRQLRHIVVKQYSWKNIKSALEFVRSNPEMLGRVVCYME